MQSVADPKQMFDDVNNYFTATGRPPLFDVQLVGMKKRVKISDGSFIVQTNKLAADIRKTDIIFIPAIAGDIQKALKRNQDLIPWIVGHYNKGAEIVSLCVGAFLLASTGLLNGRKCSTHWRVQNEFKDMFPGVELVENNIITEDKRIYSSGGSNTYWNLLLYILEKNTDRETAVLASKIYGIDIDRNSQAVFSIFKGQKKHNDKEVLAAQEYIEKNVRERITINELARRAAMAGRTFERRFKQATNNSVLVYIQRVKIEAAKRLFETSRKNINEVMYEVGYVDVKAFRDLFKKITGLTPIDYRNKYYKAPQ